MKEKEIAALISLLDDEDQKIFEQVSDKILSLGESIIPHLEDAWEASFNPIFQKRIEDIIHTIQFDVLKQELQTWVKSEDQNLVKGALLVARYQYPDLDEIRILNQIDRIRKDAWLEINSSQTAPEKVRILNNIIFSIHGFVPNTTNYQAPQNNFINHVIEQKKGNALSLSLIYLIVAQSLDLPIFGVNLPEHFILAYKEESMIARLLNEEIEDKVIFYINPFNRGTIFSKREIEVFLKQLNLNPKPQYFEPCSNAEIITRLLHNLYFSYKQMGMENKKNEILDLMEMIKQ